MLAAALRRLAARGQPALWQDGVERAAAGALTRVAAAVQPSQISPWWQGTGFASAAGGGDGSSGSRTGDSARQAASGGQQQRPGQEQQDDRNTSQQPGTQARSQEQQEQPTAQTPRQQPRQQQQQGPAAAAQGEPAAAAAAGGGGAASSSGEPPSFGEVHPELKKYIEQLKQLKGSTTVQRQEVGGPPTWWQQLINLTLGAWVQHVIGELIRSRVEKEFDVKEFLEGAKDAFHTVHELMAAEDWEALKPMMSAKLFDAFKDTADAYKADGLLWRTKLGPEPWEAAVRGVGFMTRQEMEAYDPAVALLAPESVAMAAGPTGMFLVVTAQLRVEQNVTISRAEDGQVVAELKDMRPVRWRFATGPLPGGLPVDQLGTQWFLLSI